MNQLVNWLIFLPALTAVLILILPRSLVGWSRPLGLLASALGAVFALLAYARFGAPGAEGLAYTRSWLPQMGASYSVAIDGLNLPLVLLTAVLTPLLIIGTWSLIDGSGARQRSMMAMILLMETGALGTFLSQDLLLFYVFWEIILVPAYLLVGMYGGEGRSRATLQFFLYTFAGSLIMLLGIAWLIYQQQLSGSGLSASIPHLTALSIPFDASRFGGLASPQGLLFLAFGAAFFVKSPLVPFHGWLPSTYTAAPPLVTLYLAAILSKMGTYGILKIMLPLFPDAMHAYSSILMGLAAIGVVYGALLALSQSNMKTAIAYSSLSHVSYILLGLFSLEGPGLSGALIQMCNHGIVIAGLFLVVAWLERRSGSLELAAYGGWAKKAPVLASFFMIYTLSSVALPGTSGFVGEFMVLMASFQVQTTATVIAATGMVLGALYMLNIYQKTMFGPSTEPRLAHKAELDGAEILTATALASFVLVLGIWPGILLNRSNAAIEAVVKRFDEPRRAIGALLESEGAAPLSAPEAPSAARRISL